MPVGRPVVLKFAAGCVVEIPSARRRPRRVQKSYEDRGHSQHPRSSPDNREHCLRQGTGRLDNGAFVQQQQAEPNNQRQCFDRGRAVLKITMNRPRIRQLRLRGNSQGAFI